MAGDNILLTLGDLVISVLIGYAGALEFLYVIRHLYHWSCNHMNATQNDADDLKSLQERMRKDLAAAEDKEQQMGLSTMKDGVAYMDGFRVDPEDLELERLRAEQSTQEGRERRKKEIEAELKRQHEIEEQTRQKLAEAEAQLKEQQRQRQAAEAEEEARKLLEAERAREAEQRKREQEREAEEEARKLFERERQREEEERKREEEEARKREEEKHKREEEARKREEEERKREEEERKREEEARKREEEERKGEEEARKAAEEAANKKRAAEEEELKRRQKEEEERKRVAEEEERKRAAEEAEAEKRRRAAEEEEEAQRRREAELLKAAEEEKEAKEAEKQMFNLIAAERQYEQEQARREFEEEEAANNERLLLEAERQREAEQRINEMREAEEELEEGGAEEEEEEWQRLNANEMHAASNNNNLQPELNDAQTLNNILQLLNAESERRQNVTEYEAGKERERVERQRIIDENARKFLEADQEMEQLLETVQRERRHSLNESAPQSPVVEEPCLRKTVSPLYPDNNNSNSGSGSVSGSSERLTKTVKTQFGQKSLEPYSVTTKPLLFKSKSNDAQALEPQSSLSPQASVEYADVSGANGADGAHNGEPIQNKVDVQFAQLARAAPDGEDNDYTPASTQYTEDYLRSLDGIKQRPLVREDGSGRRRAFKKRRSSGSSNSSFESRASRDEELKMFTSLEEEELQPKKDGETDDFTPIKYTSEPMLKVKLPRRRHKRSPAKDAKANDVNLTGSLEMLDEEGNANPWGEVTPEHYKDMPFWKREKSMSIDEEAIEVEAPAVVKKQEAKDVNARIMPRTSTFEEATNVQNEEAMTALQQRQQQMNDEDKEKQQVQMVASNGATASDIKPNLQNAHEDVAPATPAIKLEKAPDVAPWRDHHGLLMEGISDFYDFTASINPSRSRSTSRQTSPAPLSPSPQPRSPLPQTSTPKTKNVAYVPAQDSRQETTIDVYDDTGSATAAAEVTRENIVEFIEALRTDCVELTQNLGEKLQNVADSPEANVTEAEEGDAKRTEMSLLVQTLRVERQSRSRSRSPLPTADQLQRSVKMRRNKLIEKNDKIFETFNNKTTAHDKQVSEKELKYASPAASPRIDMMEMEAAAETRDGTSLCAEDQRTQLRSRSCSPLPTADNLVRSLETRRTKRIKHNDELSERLGIDISEINASRTPTPTEVEREKTYETPIKTDDEEVCSRESMNLLVESLRVERTNSRSRSRSRSPLPTAENLASGLQQRRKKKIQQNDELFEKLHIDIPLVVAHNATTTTATGKETNCPHTAPIISIQGCDDQPEVLEPATPGTPREEYSVDSMSSLVESLRLQRARSKSPMRRLERERTPEPSSMRVGLSAANDQLSDGEDEHERRSHSPSRSLSKSPPKEIEKVLVLDKEQEVAGEETELRSVTLVSAYDNSEDKSKLTTLSRDERLRQLRSSPTTPDYDRTISQEWHDVQRIKNEILASGFKRSRYAGESLDLGSEFLPLREQTARFRRSRSPSPSLVENEAREMASERRALQDNILTELFTASAEVRRDAAERLGAKPKEMRATSRDLQDCSEYEELRRLNADFQRSHSHSRSPPPGDAEATKMAAAKFEQEAPRRELVEDLLKPNVNFEEFSRYLNADFLDNERRASDSALIQKPEVFLQLPELEEELEVEPENYHHFRRFSLNQEQSVEEYPTDDYIYVSQIEVQTPNGTRTWLREDFYSDDFEHLNLLSEESGAVGGLLTVEALNAAVGEHLHAAEEEYSDGSEDERQTVVEVDDEIDEDICDFNERGPADESHHEQSECEEAEREMDRYADREAQDWQQVENIDELLLADQMLLVAGGGGVGVGEEGAVGGAVAHALSYDSDSAVIDEIYDEAVKDRKQSGILRDYDTILREMQKNYLNKNATATTTTITTDGSEADTSGTSDSDRKKGGRRGGKETGERELTLKLIKNERREQELRYLGDANVSERQSTRLRMRYGYMPQLHGANNGVEDMELEVDLNYKPKREYNWRKNFKIDDDEDNGAVEKKEQKKNGATTESHLTAEHSEELDLRKFSLGGESITLFSQGAEGVCYVADENETSALTIEAEKERALEAAAAAAAEQTKKKKKSKKKLRKDSRASNHHTEAQYAKEEDDSETQLYSGRSSSIQMDTATTANSPRRTKSKSLTNEEMATFSPRSSVAVVLEAAVTTTVDAAAAAAAPSTAANTTITTTSTTKKKLKKRKKVKEADIKEEPTLYSDLTINVPTASAAVSPSTISINPLAALSPQNSVCTPTSSLNSLEETSTDPQELRSAQSSAEGSPAKQPQQEQEQQQPTTAATAVTTTSAATTAATTAATRTSTTPTITQTTVDSFDILKDANFYPLF